jgi:hypothetical protein
MHQTPAASGGLTVIHLARSLELWNRISFSSTQLGTNIEPKLNLSFMTCLPRTGYSATAMNRLHYKAAFVIRFDPNANIESGKIEGSVEHVASYKTQRFNCLDELLSFVGRVLKEVHAEKIEQP